MSRQNAELSEDFASTDSRLDAILAQLNALAPDAAQDQKEPVRALSEPSTVEPPALPVDEASPPKPPMPASTFPSRPLQSVPDIDDALVADESVFDVAPAPDAVSETPDEPQSPPVLGLVPPPVETPPLAPPPVPLDTMASDEPEPVVVEYRAIDVPPEVPASDEPTAEPAPVEITVANDSPQVFVLDGPLETDTIAAPAPPPLPVESEFGPAVGSAFEEPVQTEFDAPGHAEFDAPAEVLSSPEMHDDADPGWVSHHTVQSPEDAARPMEPAVSSTASDFDALMNDLESVFESEAEAEADRGDAESAFEAPEWSDAIDDVIESEPEATGHLAMMEYSVVSLEDAEDHFDCDEDLPIPDFTGVWADSDEPSLWDNDGSSERLLPGPIEGGRNTNGISVGRNELDSLRPVEEEVDTQPAPNLGRKLQLVGVVLFGIIALAVMFLDDPAVVEELRAIYDGFFG